MAQSLAIGQIIKLQLYAQEAEQVSVNTFHYQVLTTTSPAPNLEDLVPDFASDTRAFLKALMNNNATYIGCRGQIIFPLPLKIPIFNTAVTGPGTAGANAGPRQASGLISWKTVMAGPGGRGRTYVPFPASADMDTDATPTAGYVTRLSSFASALFTYNTLTVGASSATFAMGIVKGHTSTFTDFVAMTTINKKWATQKRRGSFGRPNASPF